MKQMKIKDGSLSLMQRISVISAAVAMLQLALLHFIEPEFNPTWQFISEYALGQYGWLMNLTFFGFAISLFSFAVYLLKKASGISIKIGVSLAIISGVGMLLASFFNMDPQGTPEESISFSGMMHFIGGQLNLTPFVGLFALIGIQRHLNPGQRITQWSLIILIFASVSGFVLTAVAANGAFTEGVLTATFGRLMLTLYFIWQITATLSIKQRTTETSALRADNAVQSVIYE